MNIYTKLAEIQQKLKAPKGQKNNFGNYKYRSCEDILEAVKPLLGDFSLTLNDEIVLIGERYYIKATACLSGSVAMGEIKPIKKGDILTYTPNNNLENNKIHTCAFARESESKKGMDESQITGTASSYARKYALNGLFCIDDTKDADTMDNKTPEEDKKAKELSFHDKLDKAQELLGDDYFDVLSEFGYNQETLPLDTVSRNALLNALRAKA